MEIKVTKNRKKAKNMYSNRLVKYANKKERKKRV